MIQKIVSLQLTQAEIDSPEDIQITFHVHADTDPENKEGVTYTIGYPKNLASDKQAFPFGKSDYKPLKKAFDNAVAENKESFEYKGMPLVTNYAKYMLEYIDTLK